MIDKGLRDKGFTWNPSNCECDCDNLCYVGEYLDYKNFRCRKKLSDKLLEKCAETFEEMKRASENKHKNKCSSCILYIVLFLVILTINGRIAISFVWYKHMNGNKENVSKYDYVYQVKNYQNKWEKSNK